jgi:threonine synthase
MQPVICCTHCGQAYPAEGLAYRCQACGGLYEISAPPLLDLTQVDRSQPGIWRYRHTFGIPPNTESISLGEGNTPLVWAEVLGRNVAFKCEFLNPSGSFKDRGSAVIVGWLKARGIKEAIEDSSGNAGASFAAYAARAGIKARVFVPESASGPKRRQIAAYGAKLISIPGSRSDVADAVKVVADGGVVYASHAYLPFNVPGYATAAYEIEEQLGGNLPGAVIVPVGQGGFLLGLVYGFNRLRIAKYNHKQLPKMIGVQASACAPLWAMYKGGQAGSVSIVENTTLAEGVRVLYPLRGAEVVSAVTVSQGTICSVDEAEILPGRNRLACLGFHVEPTSAIVWSALVKMVQDLPDPIVVLLTGSGYKYE